MSAVRHPCNVDLVNYLGGVNPSAELVELFALEKGHKIAIREVGRTIGRGTVLMIER